MSKIAINRTWGDEEEPFKVPKAGDVYNTMLDLALKELREELVTHCGEGIASICATKERIDLTYCDGEICRYRVVGDDYEPCMNSEMEEPANDGWWEKDYANQ